MLPIFVTLGIVSIFLSLPGVSRNPSLKGLAIAFLVSWFAIIIPLIVFFLSIGLVPDWKGACPHGWLDCWHVGKLALTPFVFWAPGALYTLENRLADSRSRAVGLGISGGAIVASVCFVYGMTTLTADSRNAALWLIVPGYLAVWYGIRAVQLSIVSPLDWRSYFWTLCSSIPFWIGSIVWARQTFASVSNEPPKGCFVVTAASRGHDTLVGPFVEVKHRSDTRRANQQLVTLWQFEALWRARAPRSHADFRRVYNRIGPRIAAQINSPWLADLTFLALKPVEWIANFLVKNHTKKEARYELRQVDQSL